MSLELSLEDVKNLAAQFGLVLKVCNFGHSHLHKSIPILKISLSTLEIVFGRSGNRLYQIERLCLSYL